jgi:histidyl-tRNA synthetase
LIEQIGGKPAAACGFAMGVERLLSLLQEDGMLNPPAQLDVYVVHQGEHAQQWAWRIAEDLRDGGLRVVLHCGAGGFKSQMKKADSSAAQCAVIIGDDEVEAKAVMLKPLRAGGEQQLVGVVDLMRKIRELIK